jgi:hypothetical protein
METNRRRRMFSPAILGAIVLAALGLLCGVGRPAEAALLVNGSFENTQQTFVADANDTMDLAAGSTAIPGWTVVTNNVAWIGPTNPFGIVASSGSYSLDLQGYSDGSPYGGVQQSVATNVGHNYLVQFDVGTLGNGTTTTITASAGATSSPFSSTNTATNGSQQWQTESFNFTATQANTLISLLGTQASDGGIYIGLDNVVLTDLGPVGAVPEPAAIVVWSLLGGLGICLGCLRRRHRA